MVSKRNGFKKKWFQKERVQKERVQKEMVQSNCSIILIHCNTTQPQMNDDLTSSNKAARSKLIPLVQMKQAAIIPMNKETVRPRPSRHVLYLILCGSSPRTNTNTNKTGNTTQK